MIYDNTLLCNTGLMAVARIETTEGAVISSTLSLKGSSAAAEPSKESSSVRKEREIACSSNLTVHIQEAKYSLGFLKVVLLLTGMTFLTA
jgi:hypothetical protein